jgi:hypothetical protein
MIQQVKYILRKYSVRPERTIRYFSIQLLDIPELSLRGYVRKKSIDFQMKTKCDKIILTKKVCWCGKSQ